MFGDGIKVDARKFNAALDRVAILLKKEAPVVVKEQAKLLVERAQTGFTPPKSKYMGVNAIKQDIFGGRRIGTLQKSRGIFLKLGQKWINEAQQNGGTVKLWANKKGEVYGVEKTDFQPNASVQQMRAVHKRFYGKGKQIRVSTAGARDRHIGRWRFMDRMAVSDEAASRYLDFMAKRVGSLKAGWNKALKMVGGRIQSMAKRHQEKEMLWGIAFGSLEHPTFPSVTVGNQAPSITRWRNEWQTLLDTRARDMVKRAQFLLKKAKRKGGL